MMNIPLRVLIISLAILTSQKQLSAQNQYNDYKTMTENIDALCKEYPLICSVQTIGTTTTGKKIQVITVGKGDKESKPGIAVIGGIEGSHIVGKELAFGFARKLLKGSSDPETKELINSVTFYIIPDVSPDATDQFFANLKYERVVNAKITDDDRDFETDEDPYEDLNNDGLITFVRIKDPAGNYCISKEDKRVMVIADLAEGQTGNYRFFSEGFDNDNDGNFNEDNPGGVNFNRNFTYNYEEYGLNAGLYPVSEPETKAVADFLYDRFNIYSVFSFGPQDNLGKPMKSSDRPSVERRITSIMKSDEIINKLVSDKYHDITGVKGAPDSQTPAGNFMEWAYYHYGRYSFSTPAWWFPIEKGKNSEASFLKYAEAHNMDGIFVPWTEIKHPDFPGKLAEVGGIKPFVMLNPPADSLDRLITVNYNFITAIAAMHPELEFLDIKTENKEDNIFRITLTLHNKGVFATCAEIGIQNNWTRIMRIYLETGNNQTLISGEKVQKVNRLEGDQSLEFSWLINGKGSVKITAGAVNTGIITKSIELK